MFHGVPFSQALTFGIKEDRINMNISPKHSTDLLATMVSKLDEACPKSEKGEGKKRRERKIKN
jgi:hypothetical protein